ncbi:MAG TPA: DUF4157 domain-containing protein, partial [Longimicrobium sp.]|nr:DUF4157 domain-containing protein [Longimicrobium sp.]
MEAAHATKPEQRKTGAAQEAAPALAHAPESALGAGAGMPLFLQRSARAGAAAPPAPPRLSPPAGPPLVLQRKCAACAAGLPCTGGGCGHEAEPEGEPPRVQPRLVVGAVDDPAERAADRVAEAVVRRAAAPPSAASYAVAPPAGAGDTPLRLARLPGASASTPAPDSLPHAGPGTPLPAAVRAGVEPVLGVDLGHVRVHDDPASRHVAHGLQARAFTHGSHIWLGPGESAADVPLLAHEAAHVVQQAGGEQAGTIQRQAWGPFNQPRTFPRPVPPAPPYVPSNPACTPAALDAWRSEVVELKGTGTFNPSADLADMIECVEPAALGVRVKFGALAS